MNRFKAIINHLKELAVVIKLNSESPTEKKEVITPQEPEK